MPDVTRQVVDVAQEIMYDVKILEVVRVGEKLNSLDLEDDRTWKHGGSRAISCRALRGSML